MATASKARATSSKASPGSASVYAFPKTLVHWSDRQVTLESRFFLLSLAKPIPGVRLRSELRAAGLGLVQDRISEEYRAQLLKEVKRREGRVNSLRKTVDKLMRERRQKTAEDTCNFFYEPAQELGKPEPKLNESETAAFVESLNSKPIRPGQVEDFLTRMGQDFNGLGAVYRIGEDEYPRPRAERLIPHLGHYYDANDPAWKPVKDPRRERRPQNPLAGLFCPLPKILMIEPAPGVTEAQLAEALLPYGLVFDEKPALRYPDPCIPVFHRFCLRREALQNVYALRGEVIVKHRKLIKAAYFENLPMLSPQMGWNRTRIQADQIGSGSSQVGKQMVKVAVLDRGVETGNNTGPIPSVGGQRFDLGPNGTITRSANASPIDGDWHGTCCAGIIAQNQNQGQEQLAMVPNPNTHPIMPVAISMFSDVLVTTAIQWAVDNGAKVISMSFGYPPGAADPWNEVLVNSALEYAYRRNVVICASSGNDGADYVSYPANSRFAFGIGATDRELDNRIQCPAYAWGSNYGPEISVMAPGINVPTTDLNGGAGISSGDRTTEFWGTSAAAPHVAAVVALIISKCIDRGIAYTFDSIRARIEGTADKVGSRPYDANGRNLEMGAGRVNAFKALSF